MVKFTMEAVVQPISGGEISKGRTVVRADLYCMQDITVTETTSSLWYEGYGAFGC